jgi:hypothetical protein
MKLPGWVQNLSDDVVGRMFVVCHNCKRIRPHYHIATRASKDAQMACPKCGCGDVTPRIIPEWRAALWVVACYLWRHKIHAKESWDPRMPIMKIQGKYE